MDAFKIGDRVRLLPHEGRIGWVSDDETHVRVEYDRFFGGQLLSVGNLELIVPALPTTPGSVILDDGCFVILSASGKWVCPDHPRGGFIPAKRGNEVVFDAGAK